MSYFIVDLIFFFLVLSVLLPGLMIFAMLMRDIIYHSIHRKHAGWHKEGAGRSTCLWAQLSPFLSRKAALPPLPIITPSGFDDNACAPVSTTSIQITEKPLGAFPLSMVLWGLGVSSHSLAQSITSAPATATPVSVDHPFILVLLAAAINLQA